MSDHFVARLKAEVERVFRKKILSYHDCVQLSEEIFRKTEERLNVSTLRRFFNLVKNQFRPSASKLDLLSKFCGFTSFDHFTRQADTDASPSCQAHVLVEYVSFVLERASTQDPQDPIYIEGMRNTILFLERYPGIRDDFQREIARTRVGQEIYFEQFINTDHLNGYYGDGLRYYLAEKKTTEAQIFGHGLLVLRYWLTGQDELVKNHYEILKKLKVSGNTPVNILGRYFTGKLLGCESSGETIVNVIDEARWFYDQHIKANFSLPFFELSMSNALVLTAQAQEALYYIRRGKAKWKRNKENYFNAQIFYAFEIYEALAFAMLGGKDKAYDKLSQMNKSDFYFLAIQYHWVLYLLGLKTLNRLGNKKEELESLIRHTGFERLNRFHNETEGGRCAASE